MRTKAIIIAATLLSLSLVGCSSSNKYEKGMADVKKPINCKTAKADIRVLESEKMHTSEQVAAGVTSIIPASFVLGVATGKADDKFEIATGDYNEMIDEKVAEIKALCQIQ